MAVKNILTGNVIIQGSNTLSINNGTATNLDIDGYVSANTDVGTLLIGPLSNPGTNANFIEYTPSFAGTTSWIEGANSVANDPGPRRNQTMTMGWNLNVGGGREEPGSLNGALGLSFEQYYETVGTNKVMEQHNIYVSPADEQTRYISFMGNLESPYNTSLYIYSTEINLGTGKNSNDPVGVQISPSTTLLKAPDGYARVLLEQAGSGMSIINGNSGNNDLGHIIINSLGQMEIDSEAFVRIATNGTMIAQIDTNGFFAQSPDGTSGAIQVGNGIGPIFYAAGAPRMSIQSTQVQANVPYRQQKDGLGVATADSSIGLMMLNNAAAADGAQQYSPSIQLRGMGWKSDSGGSPQANGWYIQAQPIQGTAVSSVDLVFGSSINEAPPNTRMRISSDGYTSTTVIAAPDGYFTRIKVQGVSEGIVGNNALTYLSLTNGVLGASLTDVSERLSVSEGAGIIFTTNNVERARFDYSSLRPSVDNALLLGTSSNKWSDGYFAKAHIDDGYFGSIAITDAANITEAVGDAGAADPLPATPSKYIRIVGSDGTSYLIPAYAIPS